MAQEWFHNKKYTKPQAGALLSSTPGGLQDGKFFVWPWDKDGEYVISVAFRNKATHHLAKKENDNWVLNKKQYSGGDIAELVAHLGSKQPGWPVPLNNPLSEAKAAETGKKDGGSAPQKQQLVTLGNAGPWYTSKNMSNDEAAAALGEPEPAGKFFVRARPGSTNKWVLTVAFKGKATNHLIDGSSGSLQINRKQYGDNPRTVEELINVLSKECKGWPVILSEPVSVGSNSTTTAPAPVESSVSTDSTKKEEVTSTPSSIKEPVENKVDSQEKKEEEKKEEIKEDATPRTTNTPTANDDENNKKDEDKPVPEATDPETSTENNDDIKPGAGTFSLREKLAMIFMKAKDPTVSNMSPDQLEQQQAQLTIEKQQLADKLDKNELDNMLKESEVSGLFESSEGGGSVAEKIVSELTTGNKVKSDHVTLQDFLMACIPVKNAPDREPVVDPREAEYQRLKALVGEGSDGEDDAEAAADARAERHRAAFELQAQLQAERANEQKRMSVAERKAKAEEQKQAVLKAEEEEARLAALPKWRRDMILKKRAEENAAAEKQKELESLPAWKRTVAERKLSKQLSKEALGKMEEMQSPDRKQKVFNIGREERDRQEREALERRQAELEAQAQAKLAAERAELQREKDEQDRIAREKEEEERKLANMPEWKRALYLRNKAKEHENSSEGEDFSNWEQKTGLSDEELEAMEALEPWKRAVLLNKRARATSDPEQKKAFEMGAREANLQAEAELEGEIGPVKRSKKKNVLLENSVTSKLEQRRRALEEADQLAENRRLNETRSIGLQSTGRMSLADLASQKSTPKKSTPAAKPAPKKVVENVPSPRNSLVDTEALVRQQAALEREEQRQREEEEARLSKEREEQERLAQLEANRRAMELQAAQQRVAEFEHKRALMMHQGMQTHSVEMSIDEELEREQLAQLKWILEQKRILNEKMLALQKAAINRQAQVGGQQRKKSSSSKKKSKTAKKLDFSSSKSTARDEIMTSIRGQIHTN